LHSLELFENTLVLQCVSMSSAHNLGVSHFWALLLAAPGSAWQRLAAPLPWPLKPLEISVLEASVLAH